MDEINACIICKKLITAENSFSKEHIIPEFLGGAMILDNSICRSCNSSMGKDFEGRLANNFIFIAQRYIHKIKGKDTSLRHPFSGTHTLQNGMKIRINKDGKMEAITRFEDNPSNELQFLLTIDEKNIGRINQEILKKAKRLNAIKSTNDVNLKSAVKKIISASTFENKEIKNPEIKIDFNVNIDDLKLLFLKIAFEISYWIFKDEFLKNSISKKMANALKNLKISDDLEISVLNEDEKILSQIFSDGYHWIYITKNLIYIRIFSIVGLVKYTEHAETTSKTDRVFRFCYKSIVVQEFDITTLAFDYAKSQNFENDFMKD